MKLKTAYAMVAAAVMTILPPAVSAQQPSPLIIVNDVPTELTDLKQIAPQDIESIDIVAVDESTVERYGPRANNGVVRVTLRYDEAARFEGGGTFDEYVAARTVWKDSEPAARVAVRYTVGADGRITVGEVLQATDKRLKRRVLNAMKEAAARPLWSPARRKGAAVETERVLQIQLPAGKPMPREPYVIIL